MRFLVQKISELDFGWNQRTLTEKDLHRLCRRFRIKVTEMPLRTDGFYYRVKGRDYIAVNSRLSGPIKLLVLFHELGHFLFHTPKSGATANFHGVGGNDRTEREADAFALCAILPFNDVVGRTVEELIDSTELPPEKIAERIELLKRYGF